MLILFTPKLALLWAAIGNNSYIGSITSAILTYPKSNGKY
jgi:hypothetical protein|tara:strand:+ start:582 stop:701 length:120 start_codon:yes stop_codon:yes gene_type:complete